MTPGPTPLGSGEVDQRLARARAQVLAQGARAADVAEVLTRAGPLQAQDLWAMDLALRVRAPGLTRPRIRHALEGERLAVRAWLMRGTLHLVPSTDLRWMLRLFAPLHQRAAQRRLRQLELDPPLCRRAERLIVSAITDEGPLTRAELTGHLGALGVPDRGQQAIHLIRWAALSAAICHGPLRSGEQTFVLLDDWVPDQGPGYEGERADIELAARYAHAFGPGATAQDFADWSGLPLPRSRTAWAATDTSGEERRPADEPGAGSGLAGGEDGAAPDVRLLPAYDNYLQGRRGRELSVPSPQRKLVWPGGGVIRPTVLVDGLAVGTWSGGTRGRLPEVQPFPERPALAPRTAEGIAEEREAVARFSGDDSSP
ncbi:winged helix DNA-binding domain-containing protein [Streptomyces sp. NPDC005438]|uniref:winged helix DNA-binding domain-containing protein n=1 Tax=Streptomyces sp. NPDC005438 TaxID=3156880 RepID=UPI0033BC3382